jgi:hypothetical protein
MDLTYTPGGDLPTGGGDQGPIYDGANPPHGMDESTPRGEDGPDFDPGPALMVAGSDAYNAVVEGGGSHMEAMQAMGGAIMEAGAEMGIPAEDMSEGMAAFTEGYNTAQTEGGDAGTCINAGFDSADGASDNEMRPPEDYPITEPSDFPAPGEGLIGEAGAVDLPSEMTHDYAEGPMPDDHPANEHEAGDTYGPGSDGCAHVDEEGNPMPAPSIDGDMFGSAPEVADDAVEGDHVPVIGDPGFVEAEAVPMPNAGDDAMASAEAAEVAAAVAAATEAGDNGVVNDGVVVDGVATASGNTDEGVSGGGDGSGWGGGSEAATPGEGSGGDMFGAPPIVSDHVPGDEAIPVIGDPDFVEAAPVPTPEGDMGALMDTAALDESVEVAPVIGEEGFVEAEAVPTPESTDEGMG